MPLCGVPGLYHSPYDLELYACHPDSVSVVATSTRGGELMRRFARTHGLRWSWMTELTWQEAKELVEEIKREGLELKPEEEVSG